MDINEPLRLELALTSSEPSRAPLLSQTNSPPRTPTLPQCKKIRRKPSFLCRVDSSEELPSSHESIFQAEYFSNSNSEDSGRKIELWPPVTLTPLGGQTISLSIAGHDENARDQLLSPTIGSTPILYGHGTPLPTIVEQKSTATIRRSASSPPPKSVSGLSFASVSTPNLLGHRNSFDLPVTVTLRSPRRRKSFSADDLAIIKRSYHDACYIISRTKRSSLPIHEVYAEPRTPVIPPLERPSTPPGIPSWTAAQNATRQSQSRRQSWAIRATPNRLQRFLGIEPSPVDFHSRIPISCTLQRSEGIIQQGGDRRSISRLPPARAAPRFHPTRSGHGTGPLEMHPFLRAGPAEAKSGTSPAIPRVQLSNIRPLHASGPSVTPRTAAKGKRKRGQRGRFIPFVVSRLDTPDPSVMCVPHIPESGQGSPIQCPHRRGRRAFLRRLSHRSEVVVPDPHPIVVSYSLLSTTGTEGDASQQPVPSLPLAGLQMEVQTQANDLSARGNLRSARSAPSNPVIDQPATRKPQNQQCWKCRVSGMISKIDSIWDSSAKWCCWIFCGVDIDDDGEVVGAIHEYGVGRGGQEVLGPRRVILDGLPVVVY